MQEGKQKNETITHWIEKISSNSSKKGWYKDDKDFVEFLMSLNSELTGAFELFKKSHSAKEVEICAAGYPVGVPAHLAEIVVKIFDICGYYKIDLETIIIMNNEFKKTLPYRRNGLQMTQEDL